MIVNGRPTETSAGVLAELVKECADASVRVAVVLNGCVVPADEQAAATLKDGDRVDLLTFAGGG
jgi:thiamine biosynthesis protein ThiS